MLRWTQKAGSSLFASPDYRIAICDSVFVIHLESGRKSVSSDSCGFRRTNKESPRGGSGRGWVVWGRRQRGRVAGWGPGRREAPMGKQGDGTFVPFVSSSCSRPASPGPCAGPLCGGEAWALAPALLSSLHSQAPRCCAGQ